MAKKFTGKVKRITKHRRVSRAKIRTARRKLQMPTVGDFLKK